MSEISEQVKNNTIKSMRLAEQMLDFRALTGLPYEQVRPMVEHLDWHQLDLLKRLIALGKKDGQAVVESFNNFLIATGIVEECPHAIKDQKCQNRFTNDFTFGSK